MRALVTGAAGFVGGWLTRALAERGDEVAGARLSVDADAPRPADDPVGQWFDGDIRDPAVVRRMLDGARPDLIVHLAGISSVGESERDPAATIGINVGAAATLLAEVATRRAAGTIDPVVLVIGSAEQYGRHDEGQPLAEDAELRPQTLYASSKAAQETVALQRCRRDGVRVICVRSFNHTGPGQSGRFLMPALVERALALRTSGGSVLRLGNMTPVRDVAHVSDVVAGYILLAEHGVAGEVYNVCRGVGHSVREIAETVLARVGVAAALEEDPALVRPVDVPVLVGDPSRLRARTGWAPARSLDDSSTTCSMPRRTDIHRILADRLRSDRHRAGRGVRLLRNPGGQGAAGGGLRGHPRELQSGDDHDRPGVRRPHLHRAGDAGVRGAGHRARAARRAAADHGRADGAQRRDGARRARRAGEVRRGADRREGAGDQDGRGPRSCSPRRWRASGWRCRRGGIAHTLGRGARDQRVHRLSRRSSGRRSRSAAPAAASRTTARSSRRSCAAGSPSRPTSQVLIERALLGWKEFELEVMRDHADNVVIVCSIENLDPMGVHTGDSITVAPAMTLTDREYQLMRDAAVAIIREIGVEAGGCNIQFAVNPRRRRDDRDRDESARVALLGARLQGHRLPDRAHRRQARRRLHARRDPERHHAGPRRRRSSRCSTTWW